MKANCLRCFLLIILCYLSVLCPVFTEAQLITTIAGNGITGFSGDGGIAIDATFNRPYGLVFDHAGNLYISDVTNNRIRKVDVTGTITTMAGSSFAGYYGDGGFAAAAGLNNPSGIAMDNIGNLYIADCYDNRIRKIDTFGTINTIAGNGTMGFSGDGGPATLATLHLPVSVAADSAGNIYIADKGNNRIRKINPSGIITSVAGTGSIAYSGDGGPATAAKFHDPDWVATWHRNVYIADCSNGRIRMIDTNGLISTIAGNGSLTFSGDGGPATDAGVYPSSVYLDSAGTIYIGDNNRVRKINSLGIINTIAGNGLPGYSNDNCSATNAMLHTPLGMALDDSGNLCIADYINNRVRRLNTHSGINHPPVFSGGHFQALTVCENLTDSINVILTVTDADTGQTITWSMPVPPLHGTAMGTYDTLSATGTIIPRGLYYSPTPGFTGSDSIKILVVDCAGAVDSSVIHITVANCTLSDPGLIAPPPDDISVFPNPNNGTFTIAVSSDKEPATRVTILNLMEEIIMETEIKTNHPDKLSIGAGPGIYFLKATNINGNFVSKIVVY